MGLLIIMTDMVAIFCNFWKFANIVIVNYIKIKWSCTLVILLILKIKAGICKCQTDRKWVTPGFLYRICGTQVSLNGGSSTAKESWTTQQIFLCVKFLAYFITLICLPQAFCNLVCTLQRIKYKIFLRELSW